jgi:hypothetical protein
MCGKIEWIGTLGYFREKTKNTSVRNSNQEHDVTLFGKEPE